MRTLAAGWALAVIAGLAACGARVTPAPPPSTTDLAFEITPTDLGVHPPGELPTLTVAIVNHSATTTYVVPRPHRLAYEHNTIYFEYERLQPDGAWQAQGRTFFMNDSLPAEDPHATFELAPGGRVVLDNAGIPPLTFADDVVGTLRARLVYDVDAEWTRRGQPAPTLAPITSNLVELTQTSGPLEVTLAAIGPIIVGQALDLPRVLRVTVRNRSAQDVTIFGPGEDAGIGFDIERPNGGTWPVGDRPVMDVAPGTARPVVLHPGEVIDVFGPDAALGAAPGTWRYPAAERFRLRANFYQPTTQRFHYSDWVTMQAVTPST